MEPNIEWKDIVGFEGYQVSNTGLVRSQYGFLPDGNGRGARGLIDSWKSIKGSPNTSGYFLVQLTRDGKRHSKLIHRLVLEQFVGQPPTPKSQGRHADGNQLNNTLSNLSWGTTIENARDRFNDGYDRKAGDDRTITPEDVKQIMVWVSEGISNSVIGNRLGVSNVAINNIRNGYSWSDVTGIIPPEKKKPHSKLTMEKAEEIRELHRQGLNYTAIAKQYGVGYKAIERVVRNIRWKKDGSTIVPSTRIKKELNLSWDI